MNANSINYWEPASNRDLGIQLPMLMNVTGGEESRLYRKAMPVNHYLPVNTHEGGYLASALRAQPRTPSRVTDSLSKREREVLKLAATGCSNKEIAFKCCLSEATVKTHFHNIFSKIGVTNRTAAVVLATAEGLLSMDIVPKSI